MFTTTFWLTITIITKLLTSLCFPLNTTAKATCPIKSFLLNSNFPTVSMSPDQILLRDQMKRTVLSQVASLRCHFLLRIVETAGKLTPSFACHQLLSREMTFFSHVSKWNMKESSSFQQFIIPSIYYSVDPIIFRKWLCQKNLWCATLNC